LGRSDLAGKTGTTNDQKDAWFTGFNHDIVTTVWVGYDSNESLGRRETGASAALPLWIDYMAVALEDIPERAYEKPGGIVAVRIDPNTGLRAKPGNPDAVFEYFTPDSVPDAGSGTRRSPDDLNPNQLF
jgi:penicillin-binding protein 1A